VWKVRANPKQLGELVTTLVEHGCRIETFEESQTKEQAALRQRMIDTQKEGFVFPTENCPSCALFDPVTNNYCGAHDWEDSLLKGVLSNHSKAQEDWDACPIQDRILTGRPRIFQCG
jgi:hypothetical protein